MTPLDWVIVGIFVVSFITAAMNGFFVELFSIAGFDCRCGDCRHVLHEIRTMDLQVHPLGTSCRCCRVPFDRTWSPDWCRHRRSSHSVLVAQGRIGLGRPAAGSGIRSGKGFCSGNGTGHGSGSVFSRPAMGPAFAAASLLCGCCAPGVRGRTGVDGRKSTPWCSRIPKRVSTIGVGEVIRSRSNVLFAVNAPHAGSTIEQQRKREE